MSLSTSRLEELVNLEKVTNDDASVMNILLRAINDWPEPISTLAEYEGAIEKFVGGRTLRTNLAKKPDSSDRRGESWKLESMTEVLDVFTYFPDKSSLKEIIDYLDEKYLNSEF